MRNITRDKITAAVTASFAGAQDERFRFVLARLVAHLHDFARETRLTHEEWKAGIDFLYRAGKISDEGRNEFVLASDVLGLSSLVDLLQTSPDATERSALGPFHAPESPALPVGGDLVKNNTGEPMLVRGRVLDDADRPLAGATLDFWQATAGGHYWQQDPAQDQHNLRCKMTTGADGRYTFTTVRPGPYTVPYDGPVGAMLRAGARHAWRPAHFHFIVGAPGHEPLTTELFFADDRYLEQDAVFGVRASLVVELKKDGTAQDARGLELKLQPPFYLVDFDFRLKRQDSGFRIQDSVGTANTR